MLSRAVVFLTVLASMAGCADRGAQTLRQQASPAVNRAAPSPTACAPDDEEAWTETIVPWISSVLLEVGAPEGWRLTEADIHDTRSALSLTPPRYPDRMDVYVHAGVPDLE